MVLNSSKQESLVAERTRYRGTDSKAPNHELKRQSKLVRETQGHQSLLWSRLAAYLLLVLRCKKVEPGLVSMENSIQTEQVHRATPTPTPKMGAGQKDNRDRQMLQVGS